ncbi:hypothetical protein BPNPMPFG_005155 [Mesorhizobium sp. AR07]|uniref:hypothetical protein n=1 Tax=Mesorhizobium sp. AR07 TaxID=2865838 RepID=UPI002160A2FB|nr:hypothetical protein [Mesorhizobium sp. AR07]UVK43367.1 hypothetical protein BPNPMPFG_005155 [Mesorhizobium sp. AR07]
MTCSIGAGASILLIAHVHELGWIGLVIAFLLNPSPWIIVPALVVGFLLLYLDNKRHRNPVLVEAVEAPESRLVPNWPIRDLFLHIDPSITKNPYRDPETEVARDILDYLATGRLHSWGRFTGSNGALVPIPEDFWKEAEWVMMFFGPDDAEQIHARYPANNKGYRDIQFNKAEALANWPKSIATVWPDFAKWDKIDPLEAYQAACLWADEEPKLPWPSWGAEKIYRKLNDAALAHDLLVGGGDTVRKATLDAIETVTSKAINPHGEVWREDMRKLAEKWGEKPKFLYPRSRV